jgi:hypothetical protein
MLLIMDDAGYVAVIYLGMEQERRRKDWAEREQEQAAVIRGKYLQV